MGLLMLLKRKMNELESHLEYELGVDKLRTLCNKELMFSKNQIGNYNYQKNPLENNFVRIY